MTFSLRAAFLLGAVYVISAQPALAQEDAAAAPAVQNDGIEEIVVTAQKRSENVQNVPIAVAAFSGAAIQQKGIDSVAQLANLTPSVQLSATSQLVSSPSVLSGFIRGIGQDEIAMNFEPGVGIYVDGVYLARTAGSNIDLLDVERIEILKGPQGTLFGRNTIGGAISVVTRQPKNEFGFSGQITAGRFKRIDVGGVVDIPLVEDKLLSSIAFSAKNRDGWQKRVPYPGPGTFVVDPVTSFPHISYGARETAGGIDEQSIRGKLLWRATDRLEVTLIGDYMHSSSSANPNTLLDVSQTWVGGPLNGLSFVGLYNLCINTPSTVLTGIGLGAVCGPRRGAPALAGVNTDGDPTNDRATYDNRYVTGDPNRSYETSINFSRMKNYGATALLSWDLGGPTLKSISAYRRLDWSVGTAWDNSAVQGFEGSFRIPQRQYSQEFQLTGNTFDDRLSYLFGLYYFHEAGSYLETVVMPAALFQIVADQRLKTDSYAAFTHLNYKVSDFLSFTVGGRYTKEKKSLLGNQREDNLFFVKAGLPPFLFPDPTDLRQFYPTAKQNKKFTNFSPRLGVEVHPLDNVMVYGSYSKGFKSGGWTTRLTFPAAPNPNLPADKQAPGFDEEKATTFEVGVKSRFLDRRLQLNFAAFSTKYNGIQLQIQQGTSPTFINAGDATIRGLEVEAVALVTDAFRLNASFGYIDAYYRNIDDPSGKILVTNALPRVPEWTASLSPEYRIDLAEKGSITLRSDYAYRSSTPAEAENTPELFTGELHLVNASMTYAAAESRWSVTVGGNNVFNKRYVANGFDQRQGIGFLLATYNRPAEWYVTGRFNF